MFSIVTIFKIKFESIIVEFTKLIFGLTFTTAFFLMPELTPLITRFEYSSKRSTSRCKIQTFSQGLPHYFLKKVSTFVININPYLSLISLFRKIL